MLHEKRLARQINQYQANGSKLNILKENYMVNERRRGEKKQGKKEYSAAASAACRGRRRGQLMTEAAAH